MDRRDWLAQAREGGAFRWMVVGWRWRKEMERWRRMEGKAKDRVATAQEELESQRRGPQTGTEVIMEFSHCQDNPLRREAMRKGSA